MKNKAKKIIFHLLKDSLYRNTFYLMLSTGIVAFLGFIFWVLNARLYKPEQVGVATTLISVMALITNFSLLGFNVGLIRYLPTSNKRNQIINSSFFLTIFATIITAIIFLSGVKIFSPKLTFLNTNPFYIISFVIFAIGATLNTMIESVFIAYRAAANVLIKNTLLSIQKVAFPLVFLFLGAYGIFSSVSIATVTSVAISILILTFKYKYQPSLSINKKAVTEMATFSAGNYISSFLSQAPALVLPILIINFLSSKIAAYYYIDSMILGFLTIISGAATQSLLAEGSYDNTELKNHFIKSIKITYLFLIPAVLLIVLFGNLILHVFGKSYATESFAFLQIISVSSIFMSISSLGSSILKIRHKIITLIIMNLLDMIFLLGICYIMIPHGLIALGWAWFTGQVFSALLYVGLMGKEIFLSKETKNLVKNLKLHLFTF